jgi:predicted kinase
MEAVIFIGLQASGKSTFYAQRFFHTHVRINLDMLKTRRREKTLMQACLEAGQPFVIDNTNPTPEDRGRYIVDAKTHGFRVVGYYFRSSVAECLPRNAGRTGRQRIPVPGVLATHAKLGLPSLAEGFDALYYVRISEPGEFSVEAWADEV